MFSSDDIDDIFGEMGEGGVALNHCMMLDVGGNHHHATPIGKRRILNEIKNKKCCEIIFTGHQGGAKNPGGICSKEPGVVRLFPDPEFERKSA